MIELLVVIAVLVMLASIRLPALSRSKFSTQQVLCLNNARQLASVFQLYAADTSDLFPPNPDDPGDTTALHHWVNNTPQAYNPDLYLNPRFSLLAPYMGENLGILHCPADPRFGPYQGSDTNLITKIIPAVRSVSLSQTVGSVCDGFWVGGGHDASAPRHPTNGPWANGPPHGSNGFRGNLIYATFGKTTSFRKVSPATIFLSCDESPRTINDGSFATDANLANPYFIDYPSWLHNGGCTFSFCDGHAEPHKWQGSQLKVEFNPGVLPVDTSDPNNMKDFLWLAARTSVRN